MMTVSITTINYWWIVMRGRTMAIAGAFVALGMTGIFPIFALKSI